MKGELGEVLGAGFVLSLGAAGILGHLLLADYHRVNLGATLGLFAAGVLVVGVLIVLQVRGLQRDAELSRQQSIAIEYTKRVEEQRDKDIQRLMGRWFSHYHRQELATHLRLIRTTRNMAGSTNIIAICMGVVPTSPYLDQYIGILAEVDAEDMVLKDVLAVEPGFAVLCEGALSLAALHRRSLLQVVRESYTKEAYAEYAELIKRYPF